MKLVLCLKGQEVDNFFTDIIIDAHDRPTNLKIVGDFLISLLLFNFF